MSRFISITVRRLSAAYTPASAFFLHGQPLFRQPPAPPPLPQHPHSFSASRRHLYSRSSAAVRISSTTPPAVPISVTSISVANFFSSPTCLRVSPPAGNTWGTLSSSSFRSNIFSKLAFLNVLFLMCGTALSLIFPLVQAILIPAEEASADRSTAIFCLILAGGVVAAGLLLKFSGLD